MPSPLGHALAGGLVHILTAKDQAELHSTRRASLVCALAMAPDLDLLLKLVDGRNHHQAESHSVGFAAIAAVLTVVVLRAAPAALPPLRTAAAVFLAWCSHLLLDWMNVDTHPPIGLMAFWPLTQAYFKSPIPVFMDIGRTLDLATMRHDAVAVAWECALLVPAVLVSWRARSVTG